MTAPRLTPARVRVIFGSSTVLEMDVIHVGPKRATLRAPHGMPRYYSLADGYQYGEGYSVIHTDDLESLRSVTR